MISQAPYYVMSIISLEAMEKDSDFVGFAKKQISSIMRWSSELSNDHNKDLYKKAILVTQ